MGLLPDYTWQNMNALKNGKGWPTRGRSHRGLPARSYLVSQEGQNGEPAQLSDWRRALGWRTLLVLLVVVSALQVLSPDFQVTDSRMSVPEAYALVYQHTLDLNDVPSVPRALKFTHYDIVQVHDRILPFFPWPSMLFMIPAVVTAETIGVHVGDLRPSGSNQTFILEEPTASLIVGVTSVLVALIAVELAADLITVGEEEKTRRRRRFFAISTALVFAFATSAWSTASRSLWSATPTMLFLAVALLAALRARRNANYLWLLGGSLALAFTMRPTAAIAVVVLGAWALLRFRAKVWRSVLVGIAVLAPFLLISDHYYGSFLPPYWRSTRLGTQQAISFTDAFFAHLVSPSRGLFVYSSLFLLIPLSLWLKKRDRKLSDLDLVSLLIVIGYAITIGVYGSTGGSSYGSRFFTEPLPFLMFLWMPLWFHLVVKADVSKAMRVVTIGLVVISLMTTAPGALARSAFCWSATPKTITQDPGRMWDFADPQFLRPIRDLVDGVSIRNVIIGSCNESSLSRNLPRNR